MAFSRDDRRVLRFCQRNTAKESKPSFRQRDVGKQKECLENRILRKRHSLGKPKVVHQGDTL